MMYNVQCHYTRQVCFYNQCTSIRGRISEDVGYRCALKRGQL